MYFIKKKIYFNNFRNNVKDKVRRDLQNFADQTGFWQDLLKSLLQAELQKRFKSVDKEQEEILLPARGSERRPDHQDLIIPGTRIYYWRKLTIFL